MEAPPRAQPEARPLGNGALHTMTQVLGRPLTFARPSETEYLNDLAEQGRPQDYIDVQKMIYRVVRLNVSAFPNWSVRQLTGKTRHRLRPVRPRPPTHMVPSEDPIAAVSWQPRGQRRSD